jgi:hypothetical protein
MMGSRISGQQQDERVLRYQADTEAMFRRHQGNTKTNKQVHEHERDNT